MPEDLRLLALDGGGVRGLSALIILKKLMETVNQDAPPKPCEYFDMIGGTSTGGLIAIMLGRLRMTIDECIDAYLNLSEKVFQKKRSRFGLTGQIRGRFDSVELERAVKETIKERGLRDDVLLKDSDEAACKVFVCATSKQTSRTVCLTSYSSPRGNSDLLNNAKIWEACRATSAASSFFEPIAIGRYGEEFVDGATGANNPVMELWDQAKLLWGPEPLERRLRCLVSVGTGLSKLEAFGNDLRYIGPTLIALATETETTAERFRRDKADLGTDYGYFRFNVTRGLEGIGLEESKKRNQIAAATHHYIDSEDVLTQMRSCAGTLVDRGHMNQFRTAFTLEGTARVTSFVERPEEMARLEHMLLPGRKGTRQKVFVLHGLGGIGKTQLALEFAHRHRNKFSSVFWLNGSSVSNLKLSIAKCAARIPANQISDPSRRRLYSTSLEGELDDVVEEVMAWLAQPENTRWLLVFDGVDRDYIPNISDSLSYDVRRYFSSKTHGSILITTRLARPEQLEGSHLVRKMNRVQAQQILQSWCSHKFNQQESDQLFELLDGLPLALAQAGAHLQQSGISLCTYLAGYKQHWSELMRTSDELGLSLTDHLDRTLWTTWSMSFDAVQKRDPRAVDLLRLWSFLDNKDLCFEMFETAFAASREAEAEVPKLLESLAASQLLFTQSMVLLRKYSLVESVEGRDSYAIHPVVHRWARNAGRPDFDRELARLAAVVVGFAVPAKTAKNGPLMQRRLLPHAEACYELVVGNTDCKSEGGTTSKECGTFLKAIHLLGILYTDVGRPEEAEALYLRALRGNEAWGAKHIVTLNTVHNLGYLYASLGRTTESEAAYRRALAGFEETVGPNHSLTLDTVNNLGIFFKNQGRLKEAEDLYLRALRGKNDVYGSEHVSTLETINNLGVLYRIQGKPQNAETLLLRVLECNEDALGSKHALSLDAASNLGSLYATKGKTKQAEDLYLRALEGRETLWGPHHATTLDVIHNLGNLYAGSGRTEDAERMYSRALEGYKEVWGTKHISTLDTLNSLGSLRRRQGRFTEAEELFLQTITGHEKLCGPEHTSTLDALNNLGNVYVDLDRWKDAEETYTRALKGFERAEGNHKDSIRYLRDRVSTIREIRENVQISKEIAPASEMECSDTESEVLEL